MSSTSQPGETLLVEHKDDRPPSRTGQAGGDGPPTVTYHPPRAVRFQAGPAPAPDTAPPRDDTFPP